MAWPPPNIPNRQNSTPQLDSHPADHNALADFVAEAYPRIDAGYDPWQFVVLTDPPEMGAQGIPAGVDEDTTLVSFNAMRSSRILIFDVSYLIDGGITVSSPKGDIANVGVFKIPASWGKPLAPRSACGSSVTGRIGSHVMLGGIVYLGAVAGSADILPGDGVSVSGTIILEAP